MERPGSKWYTECAMKRFLFWICIGTMLFASADAAELITFGTTGEEVVRIQLRLRELGFFNYKPTGNYQSLTVDAAMKFQQLQKDKNGRSILADGKIGDESRGILFSDEAARAYISASIPVGPSLSGNAKLTGKLVAWSTVKEMLVLGSAYLVTDYNTGTSFYMSFSGGENHAEMECTTAGDTEKYKNCFGNAYTYFKRPVVITIDGQNIAASLQGCPHGESRISGNDMPGFSCLYFDGSLSHVGMLPDTEHSAQVYKAAGR